VAHPCAWDYWQLTRDEPLILEELAAFREVGGRSLVDLTMPGVGRDPAWLAGIARASGLHVVMGCGWYRAARTTRPDADRPTIGRRPGDELVREATAGVGRYGHPTRDHRRDRDRQALGIGAGGARPSAAGRAARRSGLGLTTHSVLSAVGLAQLRIFEDEGADPTRVVIGHADSYPHLDHYLAIIERGASIEFDFLGMSFTPAERHGEARIVELLCELLSRGTSNTSCCRRMSATTRSSGATAGTATRISPRRSCLGSRGRRQRRRDRDDDGREPETPADDRLTATTRGSPRR
jgi:phosphotriesterase-related protein